MVFEKTILSNGITVYSRKTDDPFAYARIFVPVGHNHNTGSVIPGTAHFLEHMAYKRSAMFPEVGSFKKFVALKGGKCNAYTSSTVTCYNVAVPAQLFTDAFKGLVSMTFDPVLEGEIENEASIIGNERRRESKWYPSNHRLGHYEQTQWLLRDSQTLKQTFGDDSDLAEVSATSLREFHRNYFDPRAYVIVVGNFDLDEVCSELSYLRTSAHSLPENFRQVRWVNRQYHEVAISETDRFTYNLAGLIEPKSELAIIGIGFLLKLLTNPVQGSLYEWLRNELSWSYGVSYALSAGHGKLKPYFELSLPVNTHVQAQAVRTELRDRILRALTDNELIARQLEMTELSDVFSYQKSVTSLKDAELQLKIFGRIVCEEESRDIQRRVATSENLLRLYGQFWSPENTGELLTMPEGV